MATKISCTTTDWELPIHVGRSASTFQHSDDRVVRRRAIAEKLWTVAYFDNFPSLQAMADLGTLPRIRTLEGKSQARVWALW